MSDATAKGCLEMAFAALLRGDLDERDRLCKRGALLADAEEKAGRVERVLAVDFYVTAAGISIPTRAMARAAGAIQ